MNARTRTEIDLNECEHFHKSNFEHFLNANWGRSEIDLNECKHFHN